MEAIAQGIQEVEKNELILIDEKSVWNSRNVSYIRGNWSNIQKAIPTFALRNFTSRCNKKIPNPYYNEVVRLPLTKMEGEIPVGIVSKKYTLAQHIDIAKICFDTLSSLVKDPKEIYCELGLSELNG